METDFGYHIIKLTDVKIPKQRSFDELRAGIETELKTQQAQRKFAESAEAFTNGVYEQSDSLKPVAEKLKLEIKTVAGLGRQAAPAAKGVLANPKFLSAVFASDSIDKKRNTEAVEVGPNQLAAARVVQHTPARTLPLAEVKSLVRDRVVASRAAELAKKMAQTSWQPGRPGQAPLSCQQRLPSRATRRKTFHLPYSRQRCARIPLCCRNFLALTLAPLAMRCCG